MKIVYLTHSLHAMGGMERVLSVKASWLADNTDNQIYIITASLRGRKPFFPLSEKVNLIDLGTGDSFGPGLRRYKKALLQTLNSLKPDICISMGGNEIYALASCQFDCVRISEFHFSHEKFHIKYKSLPFGKIYADYRIRRFEKAAACMDALVLLTRDDLQQWRTIVPQSYQIYNPVTISDSGQSVLENKLMIAAGRLSAQKNYHSMVRIWNIVHDKHPDWKLEIYGKGKLKNEIQALIDKNGLSESVILKGATDNIAEKMQQSSALLMSSRNEGFPLALIEAALCGLPLISYDCPKGPSEIIRDGINGFLIPLNDEEGFAAAVCKLIENAEMRKSMGAAAYEFAKNLSVDAVMKQWLDLFSSLTASRHEAGRQFEYDIK